MNFIQTLLLVFFLSFVRYLFKSLVGEFYYTTIGNALVISSSFLVCFFLVSIFNKGKTNWWINSAIEKKYIGPVILTTLSLFFFSTVLMQFEKLLRVGFYNYFNTDYIFTWNEKMIRYFLTVLLVAPILEEIFIRGVLLRGLLIRYNDNMVIALTTIIFVFLHIDNTDLNGSFLFTEKITLAINCIFVSWLVIKTSNIKLAMILHFIWNLLNYLLPIILKLLFVDLTKPTIFFSFFLFFFFVGGYGLLRNYLFFKHNPFTGLSQK